MASDGCTHHPGAHDLAWGSNKIYAAVHRFGAVIRPKTAEAVRFRLASGLVRARSVTIPARPYLGLSAEDRRS